MRDLQVIARECMAELNSIGIKYGKITEFTINTRAKKRWGQCKRIPEGYSININVALLDERNDIKGLKNTIIHEILHTCEGCFNHGADWKMLADKVKNKLGYDIKRTDCADDKGILEETIGIIANHKVVCTKCNNVFTRTRASKLITHTEYYRCGKCRGKLKLIY